MSTSKEFELATGAYGSCTKIWDRDKNEYVDATETDVHQCCLKSTKPLVHVCNKSCNELESKDLINRCRQTCNDIINSNRWNCLSYGEDWGLEENPINKSFKYYGCEKKRKVNQEKNIDIDCIRKNKKGIISKCVDNCSDSENRDCNKLCHYSFNFFANPEDRILKKGKITEEVVILNESDTPVNIWNYIVSFVVFLILIGIIYILIRKYTVKNK